MNKIEIVNCKLRHIYFIPIFSACLGLSTDYDCCTKSNPCNKGEGDCDKDSECASGLKCGTDNCRDFNSNAAADFDCCIEPEPGYYEICIYCKGGLRFLV